MAELDIIVPDWPAPPHIRALCTSRSGGVSRGGFASLNLADHVGDVSEHVTENRLRLRQNLHLTGQPQWLHQTHGIEVIDLDRSRSREGDAAVTSTPNLIAVVLTADCLPVLVCNAEGSEVAAAHAGWRGLLNGVLEQTVLQMHSSAVDLLVWLGPAIGPQQFEVGEEVRQAFMQYSADNAPFFAPTRPGHYLADLYAIARLRLNKLGINHIYGGEFCTYSDSAAFFSYRRDRNCGRQASLIYINK